MALTQEQQAIQGILRRLDVLESREGGGSGSGSSFTDSGWLDVTYNTGWQDESGYRGVQYRKFGDIVWLRGACERTSGSDNVITTLPTGYRPLEREMFDGVVNSAHARIYANTDGTIELLSGTPNFLTIDIMFSVSDDTGEFASSTISDSGWLTAGVTYSGTWSDYSGSFVTAYRQIGNIVYLRAFVKRSGTSGGSVMTLPTGYRPLQTTHTTVSGSQAAGYFFSPCNISTAGLVSIFNSQAQAVTWMQINMWWSLD